MEKFLEYLAKYADMFDFRVHAYCMMPTHFHLLLESGGRAELSELMKRLLTAYTIFFNRSHQKHGHLFQGRFKSLVVDKADYLLTLSRYIHLNPVDIVGKKKFPRYPGSSMIHYLAGEEPPFLHTKEILAWFEGDREAYAEFVIEGLNEKISLRISDQRYMGGDLFAARMRKRIGQTSRSSNRAQAAAEKARKMADRADRKKAGDILKAVGIYFDVPREIILKRRWAHGKIGLARSALVNLMCEHLPWSHEDITEYIGLKQKSIIPYHLKRREDNALIDAAVREIKKRLSFK